MPKLPNVGAPRGNIPPPEIVWPPRILPPPRPPALIYLDLNHYIYLARAVAGETVPDGYHSLLLAAHRAQQQGRAIFPLSATHYVEMSRIRDPAQRVAVAGVMEDLSGFQVLLGRVTIAELEIDAMLDALLGTETAGPQVTLLGASFGWAFGMRVASGFRCKSDGRGSGFMVMLGGGTDILCAVSVLAGGDGAWPELAGRVE